MNAINLIAKFTVAALISVSAVGVSSTANATAKGCQPGDYLYHFGFADWKKLGSGWQARDGDYPDGKQPAGLSVFVNLSESEWHAMNAKRADDVYARSDGAEKRSIVLRVACDDLSPKMTVTPAPTENTDWTQPGRHKHALLDGTGTKNNPFTADKFNQAFQQQLIELSSVIDTAEGSPQDAKKAARHPDSEKVGALDH